MKWFKLFWFRLKLRFQAPEICRKHFCRKEKIEVRRWGKWRWIDACLECALAKKLKAQSKADTKHFRKDDLELQCAVWRKVLGLPAMPQREQPMWAEAPRIETTAMPEPVAEGATPQYANLGVAPAEWALLGGTGQANAYRTYVVGANAINTTATPR
jgi:hypothetical protein